MLTIERQLVYC